MWQSAQASPKPVERRGQARISRPFAARVCGVSRDGEAFEVDTVLENLSASGSYLRMGEALEVGTKVFLRVRLGLNGGPGPTADIQGEVVRVEPVAGGGYGIALSFRQYRLS
jgi:hypothetical protein